MHRKLPQAKDATVVTTLMDCAATRLVSQSECRKWIGEQDFGRSGPAKVKKYVKFSRRN